MNLIWTSIIIFCFIFSILTNNFTTLINSLFNVPEQSLKILIDLGGLIVIYSGILQIAIDCNLINKISFIFKPILKKVYKINNDSVLNLLCANFVANLLGLGITSTSIAIKAIKLIDDKKIINKLICLNISCFTLFPFTIITLRNKFNGINNVWVYISLIIITFLTSIFCILLCNTGDKK